MQPLRHLLTAVFCLLAFAAAAQTIPDDSSASVPDTPAVDVSPEVLPDVSASPDAGAPPMPEVAVEASPPGEVPAPEVPAAQTPQPDTEAQPSPTPERALGDTTVRGHRPVHAASEVAVPQDVIQATPKGGATDVLRLVPGLVASQHGGEGKAQQLFLRGFDAVHGQDIEMLVGGIPVNEVSHVHALGYADINWLIPEVVRTVRVTEGSYRAWQGDFAVAGSVEYELGLAEPGVTASASWGSFNRLRLFAGVRPADSPDTFAAGEYVQGDGFGPQRAFGRGSFLAQAAMTLGQVRLRAFVGSAAARFDSPGAVPEAAGAGFFDAFGLRQGGSTSRHQALLRAELPGDAGRTTLEVFGVLSSLRLRNNFTGFLQHAEGDGLEQEQSDGLVGARLSHRRRFEVHGSPLLLELGFGGRRDGIHQSQRGYRESDGAPWREDFSADITQSALDAWTEVAWQPRHWRVMVGGRVDVLHDDVFDALAFGGLGATRTALGAHWGLKAGVERQLGEAWRLFLNYGDGFRSPDARSLSDGERAPFVDVRGAEVGATWRARRAEVRGALFGSWVENDVFFEHAIGATVPVGSTLRGGAQLTANARPIDDVVLAGHFTAATAHVIDTDSLLPYFAPLVGRLDAGWSHAWRWRDATWTPRAGLAFTFIGPRPLPLGDFSQPVFLTDALVGVRVGPAELRLDVQNVFDARWEDGTYVYASSWSPGSTVSRLPARHYTAGPPRTFSLSLEVSL